MSGHRSAISAVRGEPSTPDKRLDRWLLIEPGERGTVVYLAAVFGLVGLGMTLGRASADALFLERFGFEYLPLMYLLLGLSLSVSSFLYAAWSDRMAPERLFRILFLLLAGLMVLNWMFIRSAASPLAYPVYFLSYEIASELLLVHLAHYLALNVDTVQAKRVAPLIFGGMQTGAIIGGLSLAWLSHRIGVENILLLWAVLLCAALALVWWRHRGQGVSPYFRAARGSAGGLLAARAQMRDGLRLARSHPLVRNASVALFFMVVAFYVLSYGVNRIYSGLFATEVELAAFFGLLTAATGAVGLLLQLFVSNRVITRFGVRNANLLFPLTTLVSFGLLMVVYAWPAALIASLNKDAIMPAFRNPLRAMFFNILPPQQQGRARAVSVMLFLPLALVVCGALLWVFQRADDPAGFLGLGLIAALAYLYFNRRMNRAYSESLTRHLHERLSLPTMAEPMAAEQAAIDQLVAGLATENVDVALAHLPPLLALDPEQARRVIEQRMATLSAPQIARLLLMLRGRSEAWVGELAMAYVHHTDAALRAVALETLVADHADTVIGRRSDWHEAGDPALRLSFCMAQRRVQGGKCTLDAAFVARLAGSAPATELLLRLMPLLSDQGALPSALLPVVRKQMPLFLAAGATQRIQALHAVSAFEGGMPVTLSVAIEHQFFHSDPAVRKAAIGTLSRLEPVAADGLLRHALNDGSLPVRRKAARLMLETRGRDATISAIAEGQVSAPRATEAVIEELAKAGIPSKQLQRLLEVSLVQARHYGAVAQWLRGAPEMIDGMVAETCRERARGWVRVVLKLLAQMTGSAPLAAISMGLQSADARYRANAIEAVSNLPDRGLGRELIALLKGGGADSLFASQDAAIGWLAAKPDAWLRLCLSARKQSRGSVMLEMFDRIAVLQGLDLFAGVDSEDLRRIAQVLETERFAAGALVFKAGDLGDRMYVVRQGTVVIELPEQGNAELARLGPGTAFGEMNLLDHLPRSASARVIQDAELLSLHKDQLHALVQSYPQLGLGMLRSLSLRLRDANIRKRA